MIFDPKEKELLLRLITVEQSRLTVQFGEEENNNNDDLIRRFEIIKKKIKRI